MSTRRCRGLSPATHGFPASARRVRCGASASGRRSARHATPQRCAAMLARAGSGSSAVRGLPIQARCCSKGQAASASSACS